MLDFLALFLLFAAVFGALALTAYWVAVFADWLWMLALRRALVGTTTFVVLIVVMTALHFGAGLHFVSSLALLIGLVVTPILSVPLANRVAFQVASPNQRESVDGSWKTFLFKDQWRRQRDTYAAPPIAR